MQIILGIIVLILLVGLCYAIATAPKESELNARTRYQVADEITNELNK